MDKWDYRKIDEYQIEITSRCNAKCPQCPRTLLNGEINPYMPLTQLGVEDIKKAFSPEHIKKLRQIFFCGGYGDPIVHPKFLEICEYFREHNDQIWLYLHSNGGARTPNWWADLAKIIGDRGQIDFGIDGLEDTNHLYRAGVRFDKLMENTQAFIQAGGRAQWNFIVFRHNEHQIEEARALSKKLGFFNILVRNTGRFLNQTRMIPLTEWGDLKPPINPEYRNASCGRIPDLIEEHGSMDNYFKTTKIQCDSLMGNKVAISAEGLVMPCNFFTHNLYDSRFHTGETPGKYHLSETNGRNQIQELVERWGKENLNLKHKSLEEIFECGFWEEIRNSWKDNSIFECAFTCGNGFTKCWDQGGTIR